MRKKRTLIHCALLAEAKPIIGTLKLEKTSQNTYENEDILLLVSGIGFEKTQQSLEEVFATYTFKKAINFGIAGCSDDSIKLGTLFCTNKHLEDMPFTSLQSFKKPVTCKENVTTTLVDMEAAIFEDMAKKYLHVKDIFVLKVVSDYLSSSIPTKEFVTNLVQKNLKKVLKYV
jgi:purine-nucleoside phosphorylase